MKVKVEVNKNYQNLGLGKALVSDCINRLSLLEGDKDKFVHTQTWSYKTIGLYLKLGFNILEEGSFGTNKNENEQTLVIFDSIKNKD